MSPRAGGGGGMSVLIHSGVAMEGFVGMARGGGGAFNNEVAAEEEEGRSEETSSIGEPESSGSISPSSDLGGEEGEDEDEVQSDATEDGSLSCLADLEDSLPIKRGLSNFFNGKAKSFSSLADVVTAPTMASDLAKQEHPFNKRRRILMAAKKKAAWPRRASCSSLSTLPLPSLLESELRVLEEEDEEEEERAGSSTRDSPRLLPPLPIFHGKGLNKSFRSPRSFSLTDLHQHDEFS